jgi:hypothetical protein
MSRSYWPIVHWLLSICTVCMANICPLDNGNSPLCVQLFKTERMETCFPQFYKSFKEGNTEYSIRKSLCVKEFSVTIKWPPVLNRLISVDIWSCGCNIYRIDYRLAPLINTYIRFDKSLSLFLLCRLNINFIIITIIIIDNLYPSPNIITVDKMDVAFSTHEAD